MPYITALVLAALVLGAGGARQSSESPFMFVQLSDPQLGFFTENRELTQDIANFEFAVANVNRLRPAFVVITGDLVHKPGDPVQMREYERVRRQLRPEIPVYQLAGNHDVENAPTPTSLAAYRAAVGEDRFTFRERNLVGIALNSSLIHTPDGAPEEAAAQEAWLTRELASARDSGARHVVIFQHHPWFLERSDEPDTYFNIPLARRRPLLQLFREAGVRTLVSGHYHQNAVAQDGGFDAITTGAVGRPLGESHSGFRVFLVTEAGITHRFYDFGQIPTAIDPSRGSTGPATGRQGAGGRGRGPA